MSVDIEPEKAMQVEDITCLSFDANKFDFIMCSHVLEHVMDDKKGMSEVYRVLKQEGMAILDVPIDFSLTSTYEDSSIVSPKDRTRAFLQKDHVRLY